jgi:two-component system, OmpR family, sensor histidine kinase KdpD
MQDLLRPSGSEAPLRAVAIAILAAGAASAVAIAVGATTSVGVSLYLLAVVLAAASGGLWSGLAAGVLSMAGLAFFVSRPRFTFRLEQSTDLVAGLVFLAVSLVVGSLVARVVVERDRAARREKETRLLGYLATKLLSGDKLDVVLQDFTSALLEAFGLARCEIRGTAGGKGIDIAVDRPGAEPSGPSASIPLIIEGAPLGSLAAIRSAGDESFREDERRLLDACGKQVAVALDRASMDARVRGAQMDAETNSLRAALFSSVTHDLRTPLASIKAGVTTLLDPEAELGGASRRELLRTMLEETDRLNRLVGNLLDLAKVRAGALVPAKEVVAVDEILEAVLARMRPTVAPFQLRTFIRPDSPDVFADPVQIDQVLTNLIENATRFAPRDSEISISVAPVGSSLRVRVADRGPGIPPSDRERVFEAFARGSAGDERPGSGLGLAIARAIVIGHGGRIWIEGVPAGGTAVIFDLPAIRAGAKQDQMDIAPDRAAR